MNMPFPSREQVEFIRKNYPPGTRVMLNNMNDPYSPVESGTRGTVRYVDDAGTLAVAWDNGRSLSLIPGEDSFRELTQQEIAQEQGMKMGGDGAVSIRLISTEQLRRMGDQEGLVLQGCGGNPQEWLDGINEILAQECILKKGAGFEEAHTFRHDGLTCMLFPFKENMELDMGKLAIWRLASYSTFGGTWLSDYVPNRLGGFIQEQKSSLEGAKTDCPLIGEDGNIFHIMGIASETLRENEVYRAFLRLYSNLRDHPEVLDFPIKKLTEIRSRQMLWSPAVVELNREISDVLSQSHALSLLNKQGLVDSDIFISKSNQLAEQLRKAKQQKEILLKKKEIDVIEQTKSLQGALRDGPEYLENFDEELFCELIDKIIVESSMKIRFRLNNGMELPEHIERTVR